MAKFKAPNLLYKRQFRYLTGVSPLPHQAGIPGTSIRRGLGRDLDEPAADREACRTVTGREALHKGWRRRGAGASSRCYGTACTAPAVKAESLVFRQKETP